MKNNLEYEIGDVIIRITNLSLWKYWRKTNVVPRNKFCVEIWNYEDEILFKEDIVLKGHSTDFEFRESAQMCIKKALKWVDKDLIPQSVDERDKFPKFIEEFKKQLYENLKYGQSVCTLYD